MEKIPPSQSTVDCGCNPTAQKPNPAPEAFPIFKNAVDTGMSCCKPTDTPCCGASAAPAGSAHELAGYDICAFVADFIESAAGPVPRVHTVLDWRDRLGTVRVRLGVGRDQYKISPGLYAVGEPDGHSPVLVTANYKLSFDHLRRHLAGTDAWILILDTRGINVWCAAGKGTFGTREVIQRVLQTGLEIVVEHRALILPQLGATGVNGREVKKACGFEVIWGPVAASDLPAFISAGCQAKSAMRQVTFTLAERAVLIPVELTFLRKYVWRTLLGIFAVSGIGPSIFSISAAFSRGVLVVWMVLAGILAGAVLVPVLLPWLPGRAFAVKGGAAGLISGGIAAIGMAGSPHVTWLSASGLILLATAISSFLAMNFTGSTPFTSPSGVEKEMRKAIPMQLILAVIAVLIWVGAGFSL